jgi:hypothetical protein
MVPGRDEARIPRVREAVRAFARGRCPQARDRGCHRGITVTGTPEQSALIEKTKDLLHYARTQGYKPNELIDLIQQLG